MVQTVTNALERSNNIPLVYSFLSSANGITIVPILHVVMARISKT